MPLWTQMDKNRQYSILGAQGGISGNTKEDPGQKGKEIASLNKSGMFQWKSYPVEDASQEDWDKASRPVSSPEG